MRIRYEMKRSEITDFLLKNHERFSRAELSAKVGLSKDAVDQRLRRSGVFLDPDVIEKKYVERGGAQKELKAQKAEIVRLRRDLKTFDALKKKRWHPIIRARGKSGEAVIIALASDWHVEEEVRFETVNGINEYNTKLARERSDHFFKTLLRLIEIERQNTKVNTLVLALLGDFITGNIHEDAILAFEENEALMYAQELLLSGIKYLLRNSDLKIKCVCHSGNHARITKKQRITTEHQNSQEWIMYQNLQMYFKDEKRIEFYIPQSYHSYMDIYGQTIRFHHGHNIRYLGGVGGITIPVNKAINEWNKIRRANIDCFGHFHQAFDGGNFVANGSMIGFNGFALSIKASPEEPTQVMFGIHSKYGKYITRQIKFV